MKGKLIFSILLSLLLFVGLSTVSTAELAERPKIINNVPELLKIQDFNFSIDYDEEVTYEVTVKNNTDQPIEAYMISFVVFDYFNERCTGANGISHTVIPRGNTTTGDWTSSDYSAWQGLTGFAFISDIRLGDGTVIKANTDEVAKKISEVLGNPVDSEDLTEKSQD